METQSRVSSEWGSWKQLCPHTGECYTGPSTEHQATSKWRPWPSQCDVVHGSREKRLEPWTGSARAHGGCWRPRGTLRCFDFGGANIASLISPPSLSCQPGSDKTETEKRHFCSHCSEIPRSWPGRDWGSAVGGGQARRRPVWPAGEQQPESEFGGPSPHGTSRAAVLSSSPESLLCGRGQEACGVPAVRPAGPGPTRLVPSGTCSCPGTQSCGVPRDAHRPSAWSAVCEWLA